MQMIINHKQFIITGNFDNNNEVWQNLLQATSDSGLHIVGMVKHEFYPQGFSGCILLAESHIVIHTYPENNEAWVDIGTCSGGSPLLDKFVTLLPYVIKK